MGSMSEKTAGGNNDMGDMSEHTWNELDSRTDRKWVWRKEMSANT